MSRLTSLIVVLSVLVISHASADSMKGGLAGERLMETIDELYEEELVETAGFGGPRDATSSQSIEDFKEFVVR